VLDRVAHLIPRHKQAFGRSRTVRIGVMLQWGVGDAVLALPLLRGLARAYPDASIELLGKPWLAELFSGEPWLGTTHPLVPPWTRPFGKYRLWQQAWWHFAAQLRRLQRIRFDLLVGVRLDPRETIQLRLLNSERLAAVLSAGGEAWITDPLSLNAEDYYLRYRGDYNALAAKELTGREESSLPHLEVNNSLRTWALARIRSAGYRGGPIVCVHTSAGNPIREWPDANFTAVLESVRDLTSFVVFIEDDTAPRGEMVSPPSSVCSSVWKSGLAELKGLLSVADVLLCCDSGVMHIGAACGCTVVAIFGPGSSEIFGPREEHHQIVKVEPMQCRPCFDRCLYSRPICMDRITVAAVSEALRRAIDTAPARSVL